MPPPGRTSADSEANRLSVGCCRRYLRKCRSDGVPGLRGLTLWAEVVYKWLAELISNFLFRSIIEIRVQGSMSAREINNHGAGLEISSVASPAAREVYRDRSAAELPADLRRRATRSRVAKQGILQPTDCIVGRLLRG